MIARTTITIDADVLDAARNVEKTPALMQTYVKRRVARARDRFRNTLRKTTRLPDLPFVWSLDPAAQARARRWYFANIVKDKRRRGGRYPRTGRMARSVDLVADYLASAKGAAVYIFTTDPRIEFVFGARQVPSHQRSGKPNIDALALQISEELTSQVIEDWYEVSNPYQQG